MSPGLNSTPRADGFHMPAAWEPHEKTWMLWPQRTDNWRRGAKPGQRAYAEVAKAISSFEPVTMGVNHDQFANARHMLPPQVRTIELSSNDAWMRDCGPTFVTDGDSNVRLVDWIFNAWGGLHDGLYFPWDKDDAIPEKVAELEGVDFYHAHLVMEGGAIDVDGDGTCLTTEECLLSPGRNPNLSKEDVDELLRDYLGVGKVIWLERGLDPTETNGHVDNVACFARPGVVLLAWTEDSADRRYPIVCDARKRLTTERDAANRHLQVIEMPLPQPVEWSDEEAAEVDVSDHTIARVAGRGLGGASYLNFYLCNGGVVMPTFDEPNDDVAADVLSGVFPDRQVVRVAAREIALGGGGIHCITQQQPAGATCA